MQVPRTNDQDNKGIGLKTARRPCAEGAEVILTGRNPERLERPVRELGALSTAVFDATARRSRGARGSHDDQHRDHGATHDIDGGQQFVE